MSTFSEFRTTTSVVVMDVTSRWGWLNWTPMKISPAATAATPAARVRVVGVMVMAGSLLFRWSEADAWGCLERMAGRVELGVTTCGD